MSKEADKKTRWREVKKSKSKPIKKTPIDSRKSFRQILDEILAFRRLKAFITDIFMIYTPILYITTYVILGSAQDFKENQIAIFLCLVVYAGIYALFIAFSGQTPGLKYTQIKLTRTNGDKVGFFRAFVWVFIWAISVALLIGIISPFFLKSRKFLWDVCADTIIIDQTKL